MYMYVRTYIYACKCVYICYVQAPHLPHHVLLRELRLDDNSLTYISPLCQAWLPLLQILSLAGNWSVLCVTHSDRYPDSLFLRMYSCYYAEIAFEVQ